MKFWPQPSMTWPQGLANGYETKTLSFSVRGS